MIFAERFLIVAPMSDWNIGEVQCNPLQTWRKRLRNGDKFDSEKYMMIYFIPTQEPISSSLRRVAEVRFKFQVVCYTV